MKIDIWLLTAYSAVVLVLIIILKYLLIKELPKYPYKVKENFNSVISQRTPFLTVNDIIVYRNINLVNIIEPIEKSLDYLLPIQERIIDFIVTDKENNILFIILRDIQNSDRKFMYNIFTSLNYSVYWIDKDTLNDNEKFTQFVEEKLSTSNN